MRVVTADNVAEDIIRDLGMKSGLAVTSAEVVAALVRRVAGFACPCPAQTLVDRVHAAVAPWLGEDSREAIRDAFENLLTNGDLVEIRSGPAGSSVRSVFLAAPAYVIRESRAVFLHGIVPDSPTGLPPEMSGALRHRGVVRWLEPRLDTDWRSILPELGFAPLNSDRWFGAPPPISAGEHCAAASKRLDGAPAGGDAAALEIIDPAGDPTYFQGRRKLAGTRIGRFVGRRERPYGAPMWCYAEIADGRIMRLLDLHDEDNRDAGPDAGRHLQMALDKCTGTPQRFSLRAGPPDAVAEEVSMDLYSPIPSWAERRLCAVGRRSAEKGRGALFTIAIPREEVDEEVRFLERALWLEPRE